MADNIDTLALGMNPADAEQIVNDTLRIQEETLNDIITVIADTVGYGLAGQQAELDAQVRRLKTAATKNGNAIEDQLTPIKEALLASVDINLGEQEAMITSAATSLAAMSAWTRADTADVIRWWYRNEFGETSQANEDDQVAFWLEQGESNFSGYARQEFSVIQAAYDAENQPTIGIVPIGQTQPNQASEIPAGTITFSPPASLNPQGNRDNLPHLPYLGSNGMYCLQRQDGTKITGAIYISMRPTGLVVPVEYIYASALTPTANDDSVGNLILAADDRVTGFALSDVMWGYSAAGADYIGVPYQRIGNVANWNQVRQFISDFWGLPICGNATVSPPITPPTVTTPPQVKFNCPPCTDSPVDLDQPLAFKYSRHADDWRNRALSFIQSPQIQNAERLTDLMELRRLTEQAIERGEVPAGSGSVLRYGLSSSAPDWVRGLMRTPGTQEFTLPTPGNGNGGIIVIDEPKPPQLPVGPME